MSDEIVLSRAPRPRIGSARVEHRASLDPLPSFTVEFSRPATERADVHGDEPAAAPGLEVVARLADGTELRGAEAIQLAHRAAVENARRVGAEAAARAPGPGALSRLLAAMGFADYVVGPTDERGPQVSGPYVHTCVGGWTRDAIMRAFGVEALRAPGDPGRPRRGPAHPLASRPGARAVAASIVLWAAARRRNLRERGDPLEDGEVYYRGRWTTREALRAHQALPATQREAGEPGGILDRSWWDGTADRAAERRADHPRPRRRARDVERWLKAQAAVDDSTARYDSPTFASVQVARDRRVILGPRAWPVEAHVSAELLEPGAADEHLRFDGRLLEFRCHLRSATYERDLRDGGPVVEFHLRGSRSLERSLERPRGFAEHARAEAAWRAAREPWSRTPAGLLVPVGETGKVGS